MADPLDILFPEQIARVRELRGTNAEFDEICTHFEILLQQAEARFGNLDPETTDLIASFDDLRREIERQLVTATASSAEPGSQVGTGRPPTM